MKNDDGAKEGMLRADVHGSNRSAATYWALTRAWTTFSHCAALMRKAALEIFSIVYQCSAFLCVPSGGVSCYAECGSTCEHF